MPTGHTSPSHQESHDAMQYLRGTQVQVSHSTSVIKVSSVSREENGNRGIFFSGLLRQMHAARRRTCRKPKLALQYSCGVQTRFCNSQSMGIRHVTCSISVYSNLRYQVDEIICKFVWWSICSNRCVEKAYGFTSYILHLVGTSDA